SFAPLPTVDGVNSLAVVDGPGTGANNLQHYPVLQTVQAGSVTTISGSLSSQNAGSLTLDFYANPAADPTGYGEGKRYLGQVDNITSNASFTVDLPAATVPGEAITATATDASGDTSGFSYFVLAVAVTPVTTADLQAILSNPKQGGTVTLMATSDSDVS